MSLDVAGGNFSSLFSYLTNLKIGPLKGDIPTILMGNFLTSVISTVVLVAQGASAYSYYQQVTDGDKDAFKEAIGLEIGNIAVGYGGTLAGAWAGAKAGAVIGSCFGPGGIAIGFFIGGVVGGIVGYMLADEIYDSIIDYIFN